MMFAEKQPISKAEVKQEEHTVLLCIYLCFKNIARFYHMDKKKARKRTVCNGFEGPICIRDCWALGVHRGEHIANMTNKTDNKHISQFASLDSMSISTPEEKLAKELEESQLSDQPKYSAHRVFGTRCQPPIVATDLPPPISDSSNNEDGWGDNLPSYTSISMHHRFGYQSVLTSDHLSLIKPNEDGSPQPPRIFGGYSGQPIVFGAGAQAKNEN